MIAALKRDLVGLSHAVEGVSGDDTSSVEALRERWRTHRERLRRHHKMEDTRPFPYIVKSNRAIAFIIEDLHFDHRQLDRLLHRGDQALTEDVHVDELSTVVRELDGLSKRHFLAEEAGLLATLSSMKRMDPWLDDPDVDAALSDFAWSLDGVASDVCAAVSALLPEELRPRLEAERQARNSA